VTATNRAARAARAAPKNVTSAAIPEMNAVQKLLRHSLEVRVMVTPPSGGLRPSASVALEARVPITKPRAGTVRADQIPSQPALLELSSLKKRAPQYLFAVVWL